MSSLDGRGGAGGARRGVGPPELGAERWSDKKVQLWVRLPTGDVPVELMRRRRDALSTRRRGPGDGPGLQRD